ncbi:MAG: response regulator [Saprospiraceae bacterium]|nr:response regulator [Saprospiraceae bacterium]
MRKRTSIILALFVGTVFLQSQSSTDISEGTTQPLPQLEKTTFPKNYFLPYSIADGLPSNSITALCVDKYGFLWVATEYGLARYDGQRFRAFSDLAPQSFLPKYPIKSLMSDKEGNLWVRFPISGMYKIDLATLKIQPFEQIKPARRSCIFETQTGDVWQSSGNSMIQWENKTQTLHDYPIPHEDSSRIMGVSRGQTNFAWVVTSNAFYRFDLTQKKYEKELALNTYKGNVWAITVDNKGHLWFSRWYTEQKAIVEYDPAQKKVVQTFSKQDSKNGGFSNTDIWDIRPQGNLLYFMSNAGGFYVYDTDLRQLRHYGNDSNHENGLQFGEVRAICSDSFDNIWVGTTNKLRQIPARLKTTERLAYNLTDKNSLIHPFVTSVFTVDKTNVWVGTRRGLSLYNSLTKRFQSILLPFYNNNDYNNEINALEASSDGHIWVATWSGFFKLDKTSGRILDYYITYNNAGDNHPESVKKLELNTLMNLRRDHNSTLWAINSFGKLIRINDAQKPCRFEILETILTNEKEPSEVNYIQPYDAEQVLFGRENGLIRFHYPTKQFQNIPIEFPETKAPFSVSYLSRLRSGRLLAVVNNRLYEIDLKTQKALLFAPDFFRKTSPFTNITEDDKGDLWFCTENSIIQTDAQGENIQVFDSKNFLKGNTFSKVGDLRTCEDAHGNLYFGGMNGVTVINPKDLKDRMPAPKVLITDLIINNQSVFTEGGAIYTRQNLTLSYSQNSFALEFSALGSAIPTLNRFAYRLDDGNWIDLGNQNTVYFSNLDVGTYDLQVKAANSDGVWNEEGVRLRLTIRPPWYRSWLAWLVYFTAFGFGLLYVYRYLLRTRLADAELKRLKDLDEFRSRFFTNITHEFRTPLTIISGMVEQLRQNFGHKQGVETVETTANLKPTNALALIKRNSENLLRLINQILDLAKLESNTLILNYIQGDVLFYLRYVAESLHSLANTQNIMLRVDSKADKIIMDYDPEHLLQIVYNLLSNAIKFTPSGGRVEMRISVKDDKQLLVTVRDTGIGIDPADIPHLFDSFYQAQNLKKAHTGGSGIGLALTKELVKAMDGTIAVESILGEGSTFTLQLPINNKAPFASNESFMDWSIFTIQAQTPPSVFLERNRAADTSNELPTILLIEDNPDVVEYLAVCLGNRYQLDFAYNGRIGIERALETLPDIIISDVMMPEKDGFIVCDTLKNDPRSSHIPIILLTAKADIESRLAGLRRGADAYIAKPFYAEELLVTVEQRIESRRKLHERFANFDFTTVPAPPSVSDPVFEIEDAFLLKAKALIEKKLDNSDFGLLDLERGLGMSRSQIFRKIKALTDKSPTLFIRSVRLQHARLMLKTTDLTISEIGYATGFSSPQFFSDSFLEEFGVRPSTIRQVEK